MEDKFKQIADELDAIRQHIVELEKTILKLRQQIRAEFKEKSPEQPDKKGGQGDRT